MLHLYSINQCFNRCGVKSIFGCALINLYLAIPPIDGDYYPPTGQLMEIIWGGEGGLTEDSAPIVRS